MQILDISEIAYNDALTDQDKRVRLLGCLKMNFPTEYGDVAMMNIRGLLKTPTYDFYLTIEHLRHWLARKGIELYTVASPVIHQDGG